MSSVIDLDLQAEHQKAPGLAVGVEVQRLIDAALERPVHDEVERAEMVELEALSTEDVVKLAELLDEHLQRTGSAKARRLLNAWEETLARFVKVVPVEYRKVLEQMKQHPVARATRDSLRVLANDDPLSGEAQSLIEAAPAEAE